MIQEGANHIQSGFANRDFHIVQSSEQGRQEGRSSLLCEIALIRQMLIDMKIESLEKADAISNIPTPKDEAVRGITRSKTFPKSTFDLDPVEQEETLGTVLGSHNFPQQSGRKNNRIRKCRLR